MSNHARRRHKRTHERDHSSSRSTGEDRSKDRIVCFCGHEGCGGLPTGHWEDDEWVEVLPNGMVAHYGYAWAPPHAYNEDGTRWTG